MLKVGLHTMRAIEQGSKLNYKVIIYWQEQEVYTEEDYLLSVGEISTNMSEGAYEVANTTVQLKNEGYYFSQRLSRELPNNKLIEIFMNIGAEDIMVFRGVVGSWNLSPEVLTLNINA